jgi:hypothetical protein
VPARTWIVAPEGAASTADWIVGNWVGTTRFPGFGGGAACAVAAGMTRSDADTSVTKAVFLIERRMAESSPSPRLLIGRGL